MSDNSRIEWTDATWNPTTGCTKVSPGCDHCYAEGMFNRCEASSTAFFFKQWGAHDLTGRRVGKHKAGRLLDGRTWDEYPAALATEVT